jgi:tetratricopeptide (TPR) repeat protein
MKIKHLGDKPWKMPLNGSRKWTKNELLFNKEDLILSKTLDQNMRGHFDIEDVINDPHFMEVKAETELMVSEYNMASEQSISDRKFICDSLSDQQVNPKLEEDIQNIAIESEKNNIDLITAGWVSEWQERREKSSEDNRVREMRNYISDSLKSEETDSPEKIIESKKPRSLKIAISFLTLSAAAVAGILIAIRTLSPADPGKLFDSNYRPLSVISPAVRSLGSNSGSDYISALEKYKAGDYRSAASLFSAEMKRDTTLISPRFFLGLTEEALGNYSRAANLLSSVTSRAGEYKKDAQWYLGLAYLKLADTKQAESCFNTLAGSPGFYQERAGRLLRRLK